MRCCPLFPPLFWQGAYEQVKENVQGKMHSASEKVQVRAGGGGAQPSTWCWMCHCRACCVSALCCVPQASSLASWSGHLHMLQGPLQSLPYCGLTAHT